MRGPATTPHGIRACVVPFANRNLQTVIAATTITSVIRSVKAAVEVQRASFSKGRSENVCTAKITEDRKSLRDVRSANKIISFEKLKSRSRSVMAV